MLRLIKLLLVPAALVGGFASATPALAYVVGSGSSATAPVTVGGGVPFTFTAAFVSSDGTPFPAGVAVTFSQSSGPTAAAPCAATFDPTQTTTDASGDATTTVTLPTGCPGQYVLLATAAGGGTVSFTVTEAGGYPNTTAAAPRTLGRPGGEPTIMLASALLLVLAGLLTVRLRRRRGHA